ncbi:MAG: hypothetical protein RSG23_10040 [Gordonibacter sp.]|uniref:hypothetical protein n=1 Tax=Gordonibacter sp. TaxID=1968902 RepID=UPI002FC9F177
MALSQPLRVANAAWFVGDASFVLTNADEYYADHRHFTKDSNAIEGTVKGIYIDPTSMKLIESDGLPTEFFSRELLEVDTRDDEQVRAFVGEWGIPFSPARHSDDFLFFNLPLRRRHDRGIKKTRYVASKARKEIPSEYELFDAAVSVSVEEAKASLDTMKMLARWLMSEISEPGSGRDLTKRTDQFLGFWPESMLEAGVQSDYWAHAVNSGTANPHFVSSIYSRTPSQQSKNQSLTSGICNQIIDFLNDDALLKICKCGGCDRVFKRKRTGSSNPNSDAIYCSDSCMERQKKRNQRTAAKNRIQH